MVFSFFMKERKAKMSDRNIDIQQRQMDTYWEPLLTFLLVSLPLGVTALSVVFGMEEPSLEVTATRKLVTFARIWHFLQAFGVAMNMKTRLRFYQWFSSKNEGFMGKRGLGSNAYPFMGLIPFPKASFGQFRIVQLCYLASLLAASGPWFPIVAPWLTWTNLGLQLLFSSQVWLERSTSYHRMYMSMSISIYFALNPDWGSEKSAALLIFLMKSHLTTIYVTAGIQKVLASVIQGEWWPIRSPHAFLWMGLWSKPYFPFIQKQLFIRPWFMMLGGHVAVVNELFFFFAIFSGMRVIELGFVIGILGMHMFIFFAQGIDYLTFWSPALLLWVFPVDISNVSFSNAPIAAAFFGAQLLFCIALGEVWDLNFPPFMSSPMFNVPCSMLKPGAVFLSMRDMKAPIHVENLEWWYPNATPESGLGLADSDWDVIPVKHLGFGFQPDEIPINFIEGIQGGFMKKNLVKGFYLKHNLDCVPARFEMLLKELISSLFDEDQDYSMQNMLRFHATYEKIYLEFQNLAK